MGAAAGVAGVMAAGGGGQHTPVIPSDPLYGIFALGGITAGPELCNDQIPLLCRLWRYAG